jgi:asparagine synthase (glutamine-hydrolysing)
MVRQHQSGQRDFSAPLWTLLMFEAFLRQTESPTAAPVAALAA